MKRMLKRIFVLACVSIFSILPAATAFAATSTPVLTMSTDTTNVYTFLPTDYELTSDHGLTLHNDASHWHVPAGKKFSFYCEYQTNSLLKFKIIRLADSTSMTDIYSSDGLFMATIPASNEDASYAIIVYNQHSGTTAYVHQYGGVIQ